VKKNKAARGLSDLLDLASPPIAIAFVDEAPAGVPRVAADEPASCGYWRRAASGDVFYTTAEDQKRCPIGAHTNNVALSPAESEELTSLVGMMVGLGYLTLDDVRRIPKRRTPLSVAVYSPLQAAPVPPDVVLVRGNARQLMLLAEAALAAGVAGGGPTLGRPTCAVIPEAINTASTSASFGCVGNRVYTGAGDDEAYFAIPGSQLRAVERCLATVLRANQELQRFHRSRAAASGGGEA